MPDLIARARGKIEINCNCVVHFRAAKQCYTYWPAGVRNRDIILRGVVVCPMAIKNDNVVWINCRTNPKISTAIIYNPQAYIMY